MTLEAMILNNLLLLAKYSPLIQIHLNLKATKYPAINSGLHHPKKKKKKKRNSAKSFLPRFFMFAWLIRETKPKPAKEEWIVSSFLLLHEWTRFIPLHPCKLSSPTVALPNHLPLSFFLFSLISTSYHATTLEQHHLVNIKTPSSFILP